MSGTYGLLNLGNTCFMNSVLQCIRYIIPLTDYLLGIRNLNYNYCPLTYEYINLLKQFNSPSYYTYLDISRLKNRIGQINSKYIGNSQHDSAEFLATLLSALNDELKYINQIEVDKISDKEIQKYFNANKTIITKLFISFTKIESDYGDSEYERNYYLNLPLISSNGTILKNLEECLEEFQKNKTIKGNYGNFERTRICYTSDILIFNLNRVSRGRHIDNEIKYPEFLDLTRYTLNYDKKPKTYRLIGIIKHIGDETYGHKIALCKDKEDKWNEYNDSQHRFLKDIPLDEKLAFLLFYKREYAEPKTLCNNSDPNNNIKKEAEDYRKDISSTKIESLINKSNLNYEKLKKNRQAKKNDTITIIEDLYKQIYEKLGIEEVEDLLKFFDSYSNQRINQDGMIEKECFVSIMRELKIYSNIPEEYIKGKDIDIYKLFKKYGRFVQNKDLEGFTEKDIKEKMKNLKKSLDKQFSKKLYDNMKKLMEEPEFNAKNWEMFLINKCKIQKDDDLSLALKKLIPKPINLKKFVNILEKY